MDRYHLLTLGGLLVECGKGCADRALAERLETLGGSLRKLHRARRYAASLEGLANEAAELTGAMRYRREGPPAAAIERPTVQEGGIE